MIALALAWLMSGTNPGLGVYANCEPWPACAVVVAPVEALSVEPAPSATPSFKAAAQPSPALLRLADLDARFRHVQPVLPDTIDQGLFEYSDGYMTRLDIHRVASYAALPLFAAQVVIGEVLLRDRESPPHWAKYSHGPLAGALAGLFVVNTVTGGLNLLEARRDPNVDARSMLHSMIMLLADAGFVYTGMTVGQAGTIAPTGRVRTKHRKYALISMGIATTGYLIMIPPFRKD